MRVSHTPPAYCSGCFQSKPGMTHVDMDVAWDGPVISEKIATGDGQASHMAAVSIDDLVLCEECVRAAAALIGMVDPDTQTAELEQLKESTRVLAERVRGLEDYNAKLGAAVAAKPTQQRKTKAGVN